MASKFFDDLWDSLEYNKTFLVNVLLLFASAILYFTFVGFEDAYAHFIYSTFNVEALKGFLRLFQIVLLFVIAGIMLTSFMFKKKKKMFIMTNMILCAGFLSVINNIHLQQNNAIIILSLDIFVSILLYSTIPMVFYYNDDQTYSISNKVFLIYIPLALFLAVILPELMQNTKLIELSNNVLLGFGFIIVEYVMALLLMLGITLFVKETTYNQRNLQTNLVSVTILFLLGQLVLINTGGLMEIEGIIFQGFQIFATLLYLKSVFVEYVVLDIFSMKKEENQLKLYVENLQRIVDKRTMELTSKNKQITNELEYARIIQQSLLPDDGKVVAEKVSFISGYFPCEALSGDFFDYYQVDEDHIAMYMMDVSGHGTPAALLTMVLNNYMKSSERMIQKYRALKPHRGIQNLYEQYNRLNFPDESHIVIFSATYNIRTKEFHYSSGGLNCFPLLIKANGDITMLDNSNGFPICKLGDFFTPSYESKTVILEPGDEVVMYTDGLVDHEKNGLFDQETFETFMARSIHKPLFVINEEIKTKIYSKQDKLGDDISYFVMRI